MRAHTQNEICDLISCGRGLAHMKRQSKKFNVIKFRAVVGQFWSPKRETKRPRNDSCSNWIVSLTTYHPHPYLQFLHKQLNCYVVIVSIFNSVFAWPNEFLNKNCKTMPPTHNSHQTVTRCECIHLWIF